MSSESEDSHGHSPAAWTAVVLMLVFITIGTFAFWFDIAWLVWASAALTVVGLFVGMIMAKMGYGVGGDRVQAKAHN